MECVKQCLRFAMLTINFLLKITCWCLNFTTSFLRDFLRIIATMNILIILYIM